jgi:hypothetical protein
LRRPPTVAIRFLDPLSLDRADAIAGVAGRAAIDRRATVGIVLPDMRRAAAPAASGHELSCIVVLVAAHRSAGFGIILDHVLDFLRAPL